MRKLFLLFSMLIMISGCAGKLMERTVFPKDIKLEKNQSALIFIRTSGQFSAPIAEYKNQDVTFIGNSTGGSIMMHLTEAGKHEYIIAAGRGTILKADLKPGMFYYVYILPGYRDGRSILICEPFVPGETKRYKFNSDYVKSINEVSVKSDSKNAVWQKNTPEGYSWFEYNKPSFITKYNHALKTNHIYEITAEMGVSALIK